MKLYELAKELGYKSEELLKKCKEAEVDGVRAISQNIDDVQEQYIRQLFTKKAAPPPPKKLPMVKLIGFVPNDDKWSVGVLEIPGEVASQYVKKMYGKESFKMRLQDEWLQASHDANLLEG